MHEKFHNGFLDLPINLIKGNYNIFIDQYSKYIDDDDMEIINNRLSRTISNCSWDKDYYPGIKE